MLNSLVRLHWDLGSIAPPTLHIGLPQPRRVRGHRVHQHEPQGSLNQLNDPVRQIGSAPGRENGTWGYRRISGVLWSRR
jgi:hypothetical protein